MARMSGSSNLDDAAFVPSSLGTGDDGMLVSPGLSAMQLQVGQP